MSKKKISAELRQQAEENAWQKQEVRRPGQGQEWQGQDRPLW